MLRKTMANEKIIAGGRESTYYSLVQKTMMFSRKTVAPTPEIF